MSAAARVYFPITPLNVQVVSPPQRIEANDWSDAINLAAHLPEGGI